MHKKTKEVHKDCGGAIIFVDSPFLAEWRCEKCKRICPIAETFIPKEETNGIDG